MADELLTMDDEAVLSENDKLDAGGGAAAAKKRDVETSDPADSFAVRLKTLPKVVYDYLYSDQLNQLHKRIYDQHGLNAEERKVAYLTELQVFLEEVDLDVFPEVLWDRLPWGQDREEDLRSLAQDIIGNVFLPAAAHLGDVAGLLVSIDGEVGKYPVKPLQTRTLSYREGARLIAEASDLSGAVGPEDTMTVSDLRNRIAFILESRLRGVRVDSETREALMKPRKVGGAALSAVVADRVMDMLALQVRMTTFVEASKEERAKKMAAAFGPEDIRRMYAGSEEEQQQITKRMQRFSDLTKGDEAAMADAFLQLLVPTPERPLDPLYVAAALFVMADGNHLSRLLDSDERYRDIVREFLADNDMADELEQFEDEPNSPHFTNILLQYLLEDVAGLETADAARYALRYANILKRQGSDRYTGIAAFDTSAGAFHWQEPVER